MSKGIPKAPTEARKKAVEELIASGEEPSPENLLKRSKRKSAPLHDYFYNTPESEWVEYGRYEAARKIIHSVNTTLTIGGVQIENRAVEFVRGQDGEGRWASMQDILQDDNLLRAYMREVSRLMKQAQDKMERIDALMSGRDAA